MGKDLAAVQGLLLKTRLLTLTGAGGSGKSRLSLQAAAELLEQFPSGAFLVELAPLADSALVVQTVANALAAVFAVTDTPANAARLWGAGERLYEEGSETIGTRRRKRIDAQIAAARAALGDDTAFDAAWQEGRAMTLEQSVALTQPAVP